MKQKVEKKSTGRRTVGAQRSKRFPTQSRQETGQAWSAADGNRGRAELIWCMSAIESKHLDTNLNGGMGRYVGEDGVKKNYLTSRL